MLGGLMERGNLGNFEYEVLQVLVHHPRDAYGVAIIDWLRQAKRKGPSAGALYTTLDRLEKKGFVRSEWGEPTPERGGRRKRFYFITGTGQAAVRATFLARERFEAGLVPLGG
jgi:PadR family transcriptional regulator, regulatory protein PadR